MAEPERPEDGPAARPRWWERRRPTGADGSWAGPGPVSDGWTEAAVRRGWSVQESDESLGGLLTGSPLRLTTEHRAAPVARGRVGTWDAVACDVRYLMPRGDLSGPLYAVTALPLPVPLPGVRISPRRFLTHGAGGLYVVPTGNPDFDGRWRVLATADSPEVRGLAGPALQAVLLDGPDLDELWTADGHLAVSRSDGHTEAVLATHTTALTAALDGWRQTL